MSASAVMRGNDAGFDVARQKDMNQRINVLIRAINHEEKLTEENQRTHPHVEQKGSAVQIESDFVIASSKLGVPPKPLFSRTLELEMCRLNRITSSSITSTPTKSSI